MSIIENGYDIANADPSIAAHAIHWVLCHEVYSESRRRIISDWILVGDTVDTVMYHQGDFAIVAFRGSTTPGDILADIQLSQPGVVPDFPKLGEAEDMIRAFIDDNSDVAIQLTGHSLGGLIARVTGQKMGVGIVTFNAAAPPSNPMSTGPNEVDYHIVFDLISAWQTPNTVRLDKGWRPHLGILKPLNLIRDLGVIRNAHSLDNFSNKKPGKVISPVHEDALYQRWYRSMPRFLRRLVNRYLSVNRLPLVEVN